MVQGTLCLICDADRPSDILVVSLSRPEMVVGWYHSHPGFGCWLSNVDINTQQAFEQLNDRAVAVVVDPIQSVKGKVVIDAFRLINPSSAMLGQEPRQTTSNIGHLNKPSIHSLIHGLNRHYYSIAITYRKTELEQSMLGNLHKRNWTEGLRLRDWGVHRENNEKAIKVSVLTTRSDMSLRWFADRHPNHLHTTENAGTVRGVQQVCARGEHTDSRTDEDEACGQARSQEAPGGCSREGNGRSDCSVAGRNVSYQRRA